MNKFLAIIPARGGSKRLPRKNILDLNGKPLIAWSIEAGLKSKYIDKVIVSSEDEEILSVAKTFGADIIKRPLELANDSATTADTIQHVIDNISDFEYIVVLQPTSPLRTSYHIDQGIELLKEKNADAIIGVCKTEHPPLWSNTLPKDDSMKNFLPKELKNKRSQELEQYYRLNGALYICKTEKFLQEKTFFLEENIFAYKMEQEYSIDIDTHLDFLLAQLLLKEHNG